MSCVDPLRLQAYFDAQVESIERADIERHVGHCLTCQAELDQLKALRSSLRQSLPFETAPPPLRQRIEQALQAETSTAARPTNMAVRQTWRLPAFWLGAMSGVGVAALSTVLALLIVVPRWDNRLLDDLVAAHLHSLRTHQLIAVESSERHTVKPWFAGRADVAPVVADFAGQGYKLLGGRVDAIADQRAAVLVYQHGAHVINVFTWAVKRRLTLTQVTRNGYHIACWQTDNLEYCAVSDMDREEIDGLQQLLLGLPRE